MAVGVLTGWPRQGRIGVGWSALSKLDAAQATEPTLEVMQIDRWLSELAAVSGAGSAARRHELLRTVFEIATEREQRLLRGVFGGELRQGALDGVMVEAIAKGAGIPIDEVRRAHMLSGDLGETGRLAFGAPTAEARIAAMHSVTLRPGRAVEPMLASPAADVAEALTLTGEASVEWKLDGARVQAHRRGGDVRLYTRNLNDITDRLPGVVDARRRRAAPGERPGARRRGSRSRRKTVTPRRFQDTMGDFGAEPAPAGAGGSALLLRRDACRRRPADRRTTRRPAPVLEALVPGPHRLPSIVTADAVEAAAFMDDAVARGQEGVMVKALTSTVRRPGAAAASWRKVKPVHTFDLVVLAVEWGHGRRQGWLSNLHLGARGDADQASGSS